MSLMNLLSWSTMVHPPTLRLASTCLDEILLPGADRPSADLAEDKEQEMGPKHEVNPTWVALTGLTGAGRLGDLDDRSRPGELMD